MAVLLLRLAGPLQSWGTRSRFTDRDTERFPSKSGVIGLLCAALGRPRDAPLHDLCALRLAARADRPGRLETDYHVTQDILRASGAVSRDPLPSRRHYLADAVFLVGLAGDAALVSACAGALLKPVWPLYLGRKSCPPSEPIALPDGLRDDDLETAMATYPWLSSRRWGERAVPAELEIEWECAARHPDAQPRRDVPLCFVTGRRDFALRHVRHATVPMPPAIEEESHEAQPVAG